MIILFLISLFLICHIDLIWAAEFEVSRDDETPEAAEAPYDEDFDSIFEDPAEDIVVEQPADIDYRNQFEESKKSKKNNNSSVINDAVETLKTLGFTSQEVYKEVFKIAKNNDCTTEDIVKEFLKKK